MSTWNITCSIGGRFRNRKLYGSNKLTKYYCTHSIMLMKLIGTEDLESVSLATTESPALKNTSQLRQKAFL